MSGDPSPECARVRPCLPGYVGEELPPAQLRRVRAHLRDCRGCRREAAEHLQAQKALRRAASAQIECVGFSFAEQHAAIMQRVAEQQTREESRSAHGGRLMVVAAAVLLAALGFWLAAEVRPAPIGERPPAVAPASAPLVRVVPYAGPSVELAPAALSDRRDERAIPEGTGNGMMLRARLRPFIEFVDPIWVDPARADSAGTGEPPPRDR